MRNYVNGGRPVVIADIAFANGSDNALMQHLKQNDLLFKLHAYAAWNTPTNALGFALSSGILAKNMKLSDKRQLLLTRYIDDWAYQANVRGMVKTHLRQRGREGFFFALNDEKNFAAEQCRTLMQNFVARNLNNVNFDGGFKVTFPWNRMFESDISFKVKN